MIYDCIVIGGGPAGLTGAIYLARFRRTVLVVDAGNSRARLIPESHNIPGFMNGISGPAFLKQLHAQSEKFGALIVKAEALSITRDGDGPFMVQTTGGVVSGRKVLFAAGIVDKEPALDGIRTAVAKGVVRYCPVCDGYEATDRQIGIIGAFDVALKKARFLRVYSAHVRIWCTERISGGHKLRALRDHGVRIVSETPLAKIALKDNAIHAEFEDGSTDCAEIVYPVLGCDVRSQLACAIGATSNEIGCLRVDERQRTSVAGLFAAGDVVTDLHQITVAVGHAAIAASAIHDDLPYCAR